MQRQLVDQYAPLGSPRVLSIETGLNGGLLLELPPALLVSLIFRTLLLQLLLPLPLLLL